MAGDSKGAVLYALCVNAFMTTVKFVVAFLSGSGSMFAEAMHTLADTGNQGLLLMGIKKSDKPANQMFSYGFGAERFFYALMSAVGIFVLGCGVTMYHGIHSLIHPTPFSAPQWYIWAVLAVGMVLNVIVLKKAIKEINKSRGDMAFFEYLKKTNDPTISAVLLEDGVACLGLVVAAVCIGLSAMFNTPAPDAVGSILIGILLGGVAVFLGYQNRSLILGQAIPEHVEAEAIGFVRAQASVEEVHAVQSRVLGAHKFKLKAEVDWDGRWFGEQLAPWLEENKSKLDTEEGRMEVA
ncbi:cation diffusion facilitator family transporter, partial [Planctomycetota bacterium]|nr:cation diffusion facilitator family transporter [Planctomycetota bacterium]